MSVNLKFLDGRNSEIKVASNYTVDDLKIHIFKTEKYPPTIYRLVFAGRQLENGKTLSDYNIQYGANILVLLKLRGGMFHETSGKAGNFETLENNIIINVEPDLQKFED